MESKRDKQRYAETETNRQTNRVGEVEIENIT